MGCGCGVEYIKAADYAAKAVADPANAGKAAREIAEETGLGRRTIDRARQNSVGPNGPPRRVTGKDGKS